MKGAWQEFRLAGAFLTRFPLGGAGAVESGQLARSMAYFPLVGLLLGVLLVAADRLLGLLLPRPVLDALLLILLIAATGALHLDGLADLLDGLAGGRDRASLLRIMKDSRVGAIGAVGLVMVLLLKYLSLTNLPLAHKTAALLLMPAAGRWMAVVLACACPYLRPEGGTGRAFVEAVGRRELAIATVTLAAFVLGLLQLQGLAVFALLLAAAVLMIGFCRRRLGGVTGDVLGAATEVTEVWCLLVLLAMKDWLA